MIRGSTSLKNSSSSLRPFSWTSRSCIIVETLNHSYGYPVEIACNMMEVSKSGFYKWKAKPEVYS